MDCAKDAAEIESAAREIAGADAVKVSTATHILTVRDVHSEPLLKQVEQAVERLGYQLQPMTDAAAESIGTADGARAPEDDERPNAVGHVTTAYRRALWIVVLLNLGYGVVEMTGGFLSNSQALKADALDFLGDGLITFLGLLAIGWGLRARASAALLQGLFLGTLGLGVLATTAFRIFAQNQPEAELMGLFGVIALVVNVLAALVLIPHRKGDANARAVWLFSRNDAMGNVAVVIAAGLVAWTDTPWPDLVVAVIIAALFLHSSWSIVRDARNDLRDADG